MNAEWLAGNLTAHWMQAGVLALSALMAIRLLNLNEPRARLAALHLTLAAIVLLPLLQPWKAVEPAVEVTSSAILSGAAPVYTQEAPQGGIEATSSLDPSLAIVAIVIAGIGMRLLWLLYGIVRLGRFSRAASSVPTPAVASEIETDLVIVSPRYIQQTGGRGPWTFGWIQPAVALPAGFDSLAPAFQRAVICHELVHIKRRDIVVACIEELAVAALWFHPWIWLLRARIRVAREQVVDSRVVTMLGNREDYVRCLVDLSGHDLAPHFSQAGAGMLRPRELRARVDAIFQEVHMSRMRFAVAALAFVAVTIAVGVIAVAAMPLRTATAPQYVTPQYVVSGFSRTLPAPPQAEQSQAAPEPPRRQINKVYPAYPQDALERGIKGVVIVDITINAAGDVSTAGVVSGPQELRASAFTAALGLKFTPGSSTTAMKISVDYTLTGNSWGVRVWDSTAGRSGSGPVVFSSRGPENPMPAAARVGGAVRAPRKIKDAQPVYPPIAQEARVQGVVIIEARVDENGNVSHTHVLRSIPLLDQAAIDAVQQWQYEPTLLNGSPIAVMMTVTVNFSLAPQVQLRINMPDGTLAALRIRPNGGIGRIEHPAMSRYGFAPFVDDDPSVEMVKVTLYELGEEGVPPRTLANVELKPGGEIVQSASSPSFGIQLIGVTR